MRSHAKASSADSNQRQATGLGIFGIVFAAALAVSALLAIPAGAAPTRAFQEVFGSAEQPSFETAQGIAVDQSTGDVLVMDGGSNSIRRFKSNGEPDPFSALGGNEIDGREGADETPQSRLSFGLPNEAQIAVDNSGAATDGDIYVTQVSGRAINVFAETGEYLGQLTGFSEPCGVAVDPSGNLYVGDYELGVKKYVPSANPPVNGDAVSFNATVGESCTLAAGAGPTAGYLFAASFGGEITKLDSSTAETKYTFGSSTTTISVDPESGHVLQATGSLVKEFDASAAGSASQVASISPGGSVQGVAANGATESTYLDRLFHSNLEVYGGPIVTLPVATTSAATEVHAHKVTLNGKINPEGIELEECFFEWGETSSYGEIAPCAETPAEIGSGSASVSVHAEITGLDPNGTEYHYRLVAVNPEGSVRGADMSVATAYNVITEPASGATGTKVTLNGKINPEGIELEECFFEWGETSSYGEIAPCAETPAEIGSGTGLAAVHADLTGLRPNSFYRFRLVAVSGGESSQGVDRFFSTPQTVLTEGSEPISASEAIVRGSVDPDGVGVTACQFEYGLTASYGETAPCAEGSGEIGAGSGAVPVHAALNGLEGASHYHYRLAVTYVGQSSSARGSDATLVTLGPLVAEEHASGVSSTTATLNAVVNPQNAATTYHVEYVDQAGFEAEGFENATQTPVPDAPVGAGSVGVPVSTEITGLQPETTYHLRVVATNPDGSTYGAGVAVLTYPPSEGLAACPNDSLRYGYGAYLPDCRAYEQATEIDKNGTNPQGSVNVVQAAAGGGGVTFWSPAGIPGAAGAAQLPTFLSARETGGWTTRGTLPPATLGQISGIRGWTPDLATTFTIASDFERGVALLAQDQSDGSIRTIVPYTEGEDVNYAFIGASSDGSTVFIESWGPPLKPGAAAGKDNLYVWDRETGALSLAGVLPNSACGSPPCFPAQGSAAGAYAWWDNGSFGGARSASYLQHQNAISADGSKAYFTALDTRQVYLRKNATAPTASTVKVSVSQKTNGSGPGGADPNGPQPAQFQFATPDGSRAFFTSSEELTDDATTGSADQGKDLYRYDVASGQLTDLVPDASDPNGAEVEGVLGTSDDGSYVYFLANGDLDGSGPAGVGNCDLGQDSGRGECSLYVWHDGAIAFIAKLDCSGTTGPSGAGDVKNVVPQAKTDGGSASVNTSRVTPDGRVLLFRSRRSLTGYANHGVPEYYRYDASTGRLGCVSCNPSGVAPVGTPETYGQTIVTGINGVASILTRNLSDSGNQFFFQTEDALLPGDINGVADVYEWEADGAGSCESTSMDGGCLYLISTGKSSAPSFIADASASGDDVFFFTEQQLVGQDEDELVDIYDAHVNGGLASQNPQRTPPCSGEGCRGASSGAAGSQGAGSAVFSGPGNQQAGGGCVASQALKRLNRRAQTLRHRSRLLVRRARHSGSAEQAQRMKRDAHHLAKSAQRLSKRAQGLARRCKGVGRGGNR